MAPNISDVRYEAFWTEDDGLYSCGCRHESVTAAMRCVVPDGRTFIRAVQGRVTRSLDDHEFKEFLNASLSCCWSNREKVC